MLSKGGTGLLAPFQTMSKALISLPLSTHATFGRTHLLKCPLIIPWDTYLGCFNHPLYKERPLTQAGNKVKFEHSSHADCICGVLKVSDSHGDCGELSLELGMNYRSAYISVRTIYECYVRGDLPRPVMRETFEQVKAEFAS